MQGAPNRLKRHRNTLNPFWSRNGDVSKPSPNHLHHENWTLEEHSIPGLHLKPSRRIYHRRLIKNATNHHVQTPRHQKTYNITSPPTNLCDTENCPSSGYARATKNGWSITAPKGIRGRGSTECKTPVQTQPLLVSPFGEHIMCSFSVSHHLLCVDGWIGDEKESLYSNSLFRWMIGAEERWERSRLVLNFYGD